MLVIPLVLFAPFIDLLDKENIGRLLGLFATYALLIWVGVPSDEGPVWKRIARVFLAFAVYAVIDRLLDPLIDSMNLADNSMGMLVVTFFSFFIPFSAIILLARQLKLYESE